MIFKNILKTVLACSLILISASAYAVPPDCEDAVESTCKHYKVGDGSHDPTYQTVVHVPYSWCTVSRTTNGVTCDIDVNNCPDNSPPGTDGHDVPGVAYCFDCGGTSGYRTINEAKCCLAYGTPKGPNGEKYC
jgi:hypothetical protein